ncbi:probable inactive receptor kinase At2g26730 [Dioscorea cayenensis subsp. rotundata]|uniref:Probable inactive receptor kinase At2g26730 n=1 Tax=Dioscorea cayennensis subsp. rotundata TaxID=55577 RepID=A0AB40AKK5_DIOCR|nr:probable inactive receptor kinase At2g26730 [Dioscorea cayenensis subsp. rotundata]
MISISISISISLAILLLLNPTASEQDHVKLSLINFLQKLSRNDTGITEKLSWNTSTDPCSGNWTGISCNNKNKSIRGITLEGLLLNGSIDATLACTAPSLAVLSLRDNLLHGQLPLEISSCSQLTHLFLSGNRLSGELPLEISELNNLKRLDISNNNFSGDIPSGLTTISGLFNISNNLFSGRIPPDAAQFGNESFSGNSGLCGLPLAVACAPAASP